MVAELVSAGRGAAAQPAFEPGPRVPLAKGARDGAEIGDLVTVTMRGRAGRVTAVHGSARSPRAALRGLLAANGLGLPFPRAALEEAEVQDEDAPAGDRGRRDLRDQRVITIDPEGAKDHDDAIAVAAEGADATRLWVHIADVSRFVAAGGPLDREAARRGTSVYVPGAVDPMLPARLSSDLCSLRPGVDRAAVTVEMVVTAGGEVTDTRFSRSLIRSERRLTYPEVDALTAGGRSATRAWKPTWRARPRSLGRCGGGGSPAGRSRPPRRSRSSPSRGIAWPRSASRARPRPTRWWRSA